MPFAARSYGQIVVRVPPNVISTARDLRSRNATVAQPKRLPANAVATIVAPPKGYLTFRGTTRKGKPVAHRVDRVYPHVPPVRSADGREAPSSF